MPTVLEKTIELASACQTDAETARGRGQPPTSAQISALASGRSQSEKRLVEYLESLSYEEVRAIELVYHVGQSAKPMSLEVADAQVRRTEKHDTIARLADMAPLAEYLVKGRMRLGNKLPVNI